MSGEAERALRGRSVIVTGSSRGLGLAYAHNLARHGARLVINGRREAELSIAAQALRDGGAECVAVVGSVAEAATCARLVETAVEAYGGVDCLVNNAGVSKGASVIETDPADFDEVVDVSLRGTWYCCHYAARPLIDSGGQIINTVSGSGLIGLPGRSAYTTAKAGIIGMTRALAAELGPRGVGVNGLWPIAFTDMTAKLVPSPAVSDGQLSEYGLNPPSAVAPVVSVLASGVASCLNGQILSFNGRHLGLWSHPRETAGLDRQSWDIEDLTMALGRFEKDQEDGSVLPEYLPITKIPSQPG
jgi:NAD(P)-dependent dehydrogenase (short-subunit alcohol dehydrogenase family)